MQLFKFWRKLKDQTTPSTAKSTVDPNTRPYADPFTGQGLRLPGGNVFNVFYDKGG